MASAVGIWPWADGFMSTETDNVLIATLSGGMVGNGDKIGAENKENLLRVVRSTRCSKRSFQFRVDERGERVAAYLTHQSSLACLFNR